MGFLHCTETTILLTLLTCGQKMKPKLNEAKKPQSFLALCHRIRSFRVKQRSHPFPSPWHSLRIVFKFFEPTKLTPAEKNYDASNEDFHALKMVLKYRDSGWMSDQSAIT